MRKILIIVSLVNIFLSASAQQLANNLLVDFYISLPNRFNTISELNSYFNQLQLNFAVQYKDSVQKMDVILYSSELSNTGYSLSGTCFDSTGTVWVNFEGGKYMFRNYGLSLITNFTDTSISKKITSGVIRLKHKGGRYTQWFTSSCVNNSITISGIAKDSLGIPISGAKIYHTIPVDGTNSVIYSDSALTDNLGEFTFVNPNPITSKSFLKLFPNTTSASNVRPIFYIDLLSSNGYRISDRPCFGTWTVSGSYLGNTLTGVGTITGVIYKGATITGARLESEGLSNTGLYIKNFQNQIVQHTRTDSNGGFLFNNIPVGIYKLYLDSSIYSNSNPPLIKYKPGQTSDYLISLYNNQLTVVNETVTTQNGSTTSVTSDNSKMLNSENIDGIVICYPNPSNGLINISNTTNDILYCNLYSYDGNITNRFILNAYCNLQLGLVHMGLYILRINTQNKGFNLTKKIIIH